MLFRSLDGEIVHPGTDGRPMFYELMRRRGPFCFYAFDLVWLDARDLRGRPLLERKALLRKLLPLESRARGLVWLPPVARISLLLLLLKPCPPAPDFSDHLFIEFLPIFREDYFVDLGYDLSI